MALAPHPDDEALGCSGTLLELRKRGSAIDMVFLTSGELLYGSPSSGLADRRREEGRRSSALIGCRETIFLELPDGAVAKNMEDAYVRLCGIVERTRPDLIFSPSPIDYHADHIATSRLALRVLNSFGFLKLAFYEVYSTIRFNRLVDITEAAEEKRRVILNYRESLLNRPEVYVNAALGLNAHRSIFTQTQGLYEALFIASGGDPAKIRSELSYDDIL